MQIHRIDTDNRKDAEKFVQFPHDLYRDDPLWVPPLRSDALSTLNRNQHPFYEHSEADFFIAESGNKTVGRIAALENRNFNRYQGKKSAFFGYFETVDDAEVSGALLAAALDWAQRRNLDEVVGPRGLIGTDGSILVEGFEYRPAMTFSYNLSYYDRLVTAAGFEKDTDYLSGYVPASHQLPERVHRIAARVKERKGFWVKSFSTKAEIRQWIPRALEVHRESMGQLHTFYPPTEAETKMVLDALFSIVDPQLIKLIMREEEIAGFVLGYPDITVGLQRSKGRLWPVGWIPLLLERRRTRRMAVTGLGLLPQYRGIGANTYLYTEFQKTVNASRYEHVDVGQVDENNIASFSDMQTMGLQWQKRHRQYRRAV